jgi:hypothetical protein
MYGTYPLTKIFTGLPVDQSHREKGTKDSTKGLNSFLDDLEEKLAEAHLKLINERKK